MIRSAISPRLAMSSRRIGRVTAAMTAGASRGTRACLPGLPARRGARRSRRSCIRRALVRVRVGDLGDQPLRRRDRLGRGRRAGRSTYFATIRSSSAGVGRPRAPGRSPSRAPPRSARRSGTARARPTVRSSRSRTAKSPPAGCPSFTSVKANTASSAATTMSQTAASPRRRRARRRGCGRSAESAARRAPRTSAPSRARRGRSPRACSRPSSTSTSGRRRRRTPCPAPDSTATRAGSDSAARHRLRPRRQLRDQLLVERVAHLRPVERDADDRTV